MRLVAAVIERSPGWMLAMLIVATLGLPATGERRPRPVRRVHPFSGFRCRSKTPSISAMMPKPIPVEEQRAARLLSLAEVGEDVGLTDAVGGGNSHGVGIGFVDVDNDGDEDLFIANGRQAGGGMRFPSQLFRNDDGTFVDITVTSGIESTLADKDCYSVAAADYDADGGHGSVRHHASSRRAPDQRWERRISLCGR